MKTSKTSIRKKFADERKQAATAPESTKKIIVHLKKLLKAIIAGEQNCLIGAYFPLKEEVSLLSLMDWLHEKGLRYALPKIIHYERCEMIFVVTTPQSQMKPNAFGIVEPNSTEEVAPDILIVPTLAADLSGTRLGYGHGYYDRYIAKQRAAGENLAVIGVCFEEQISRAPLPKECHDQALDFVVTERGIYSCA